MCKIEKLYIEVYSRIDNRIGMPYLTVFVVGLHRVHGVAEMASR